MAEAHFMLGHCYKDIGRKAEALKHFKLSASFGNRSADRIVETMEK